MLVSRCTTGHYTRWMDSFWLWQIHIKSQKCTRKKYSAMQCKLFYAKCGWTRGLAMKIKMDVVWKKSRLPGDIFAIFIAWRDSASYLVNQTYLWIYPFSYGNGTVTDTMVSLNARNLCKIFQTCYSLNCRKLMRLRSWHVEFTEFIARLGMQIMKHNDVSCLLNHNNRACTHRTVYGVYNEQGKNTFCCLWAVTGWKLNFWMELILCSSLRMLAHSGE